VPLGAVLALPWCGESLGVYLSSSLELIWRGPVAGLVHRKQAPVKQSE